MSRVARQLPFVLASTDRGAMIVSRLDYHVPQQGLGYGVGFQILNTGAYDADELELVNGVLSNLHAVRGDGVVALDVGANIGVHAVEMARTMHGWGTVVAFEPQERLFYALCGNIALANVFNAEARFAAVGKESGTVLIPKVDYNRPGSYGSLELKQTPGTEFIGQTIDYESDLAKVSLVSIDDLKLPRVDFLKIDVEGMEFDVLDGAKETIEKFRPIMLIEWLKVGQDALRQKLQDLDYQTTNAGGNLLAIRGDKNVGNDTDSSRSPRVDEV